MNAAATQLNAAYCRVIPENSAFRRAVQAQLDLDYDSQLNVYSEIALQRQLAAQAVGLYHQALENYENEKDPEKKPELRRIVFVTMETMSEQLQRVVEMCSKGQRISGKTRERFDLIDVQRIMVQVTALIEEYCTEEQVELLKKRLEDHAYAVKEEKGTLLHPDDVAREYDASVPAGPEL